MISPFIKADMVSRAGSGQRWRIPHSETHLSIAILLPDTEPPSVKWILPDGRQIDGPVIDADVSAGETLCICDDFTRCGIDMDGCDPYAIHLVVAEMPVVRPRLKNIPGRCGMLMDARYNTVPYVLNSDGNEVKSGACYIKIHGSTNRPSGLIFTVEDINKRKALSGSGRKTHVHLEIAYAPYFTGDLAKLNIETQYYYRVPNADFTSYLPINPGRGHMVDVMQHTIIHHTGVHGHCNLSTAQPGHFGFYGNPHMTPDDYDQTVITLATSMQSRKDTNTLDMFLFDPDEFVLEISSRRTSASDEAVNTLRNLGMAVVEMDD